MESNKFENETTYRIHFLYYFSIFYTFEEMELTSQVTQNIEYKLGNQYRYIVNDIFSTYRVLKSDKENDKKVS